MIKATAPGKIIIFGEHAVVYDKLGIAAAIDLRVSCKIDKSKEITVENIGIFKSTANDIRNVNIHMGTLIEKKDFPTVASILRDDPNICTKYVISQVMKKASPIRRSASASDRPRPFSMKNHSPLRKGMGGSAAIFSAEAKALSKFLGVNLSKKEISDIAYSGDVIAHGGTPSGIDNSTVTYGGYVAFKKSRGPEHLKIKSMLPLVIGDTKMPASTAQTVSMVRNLVEKGDKKVIQAIDDIEHISEQAIESIKAGDLIRVGKLMDENQKKLRVLQVSSPELERLIEAAKAAGAYGAKLSGSGGGGIMIAVCDKKNQQAVADAINRAGGEAIITQVGAEGVRIEK